MAGGHSGDWSRLGSVRPGDVIDARVQLHWAAQPLAAVADVMLENRADDSHTNMRWDDRRRALVGHRVPNGLSVALLVEQFALAVSDRDGAELHRLTLTGHTLDAAMAWVAEAMGTDYSLYPRSYAMPRHPVGKGARFTAEPGDALDELARWFATGDQALSELVARADGAAALAVWPHHFDIGGVISLDPTRPLDGAPQIGFGLSPGDDSYDEPYYYVTPWPVPDDAARPPLPHGGHWRSDGWTGAVFTASTLTAVGAGPQRQSAVRDFVDVAIAGSRALIPPTA